MNKFFTVIFSLLFVNISFSQDIKTLNESDTLYYFFRHKKSEWTGPLALRSSPNIYSRDYVVKLNSISHNFVYMSHEKNKAQKWIEVDTITKPKTFLKAIKDQTICHKSLKKMGYGNLYNFYTLYHKHKIIYLIDENEIENGRLKLRKVTWYSNYPTKDYNFAREKLLKM